MSPSLSQTINGSNMFMKFVATDAPTEKLEAEALKLSFHMAWLIYPKDHLYDSKSLL